MKCDEMKINIQVTYETLSVVFFTIFFFIIIIIIILFSLFNVYFCKTLYRKNTVFLQLQHEFYIQPDLTVLYINTCMILHYNTDN